MDRFMRIIANGANDIYLSGPTNHYYSYDVPDDVSDNKSDICSNIKLFIKNNLQIDNYKNECNICYNKKHMMISICKTNINREYNGHIFCIKCLYKWLLLNNNCPVCRTYIDI